MLNSRSVHVASAFALAVKRGTFDFTQNRMMLGPCAAHFLVRVPSSLRPHPPGSSLQGFTPHAFWQSPFSPERNPLFLSADVVRIRILGEMSR